MAALARARFPFDRNRSLDKMPRQLNLLEALQPAKAERAAPLFDDASALPGQVREMPLRAAAQIAERRFTAWRGRSGRRYVASVFAIQDGHALGFTDAVLLAVSPDRKIVAARDSGPFGIDAALTRWRDAMAGASEIHVHLLAEDSAGRRAALCDLMPEA
ncbi:conserved hypothetical protein [Bosea sp. 62]|uniref:hypothetical protein n=1 Tax=unclassified Bosea (in: a-proteobacteria) TaxID=2653178 RepID=UPI001252A7D8|nr:MULTISPECIES: hypothetical protein [unclassified Bosea (in: a-proteobacteria)]CAD5250683.1 conserved hypothetical protein [Bosea sp. 21B]CAD5263433.1 conserved hypothetical protein [Bosea sp. 7B]CAD5271312.1 conserved hypothetical protein [Bosea sp. 46]VVT43947.1 conserved hypothetical protein [Bosea sp. EC-HK365B]VXB16285.1 conserved hypothetical protein [Bosea sp. 29B]